MLRSSPGSDPVQPQAKLTERGLTGLRENLIQCNEHILGHFNHQPSDPSAAADNVLTKNIPQQPKDLRLHEFFDASAALLANLKTVTVAYEKVALFSFFFTPLTVFIVTRLWHCRRAPSSMACERSSRQLVRAVPRPSEALLPSRSRFACLAGDSTAYLFGSISAYPSDGMP